jgi:LPS-assembly lipoprotein
MAGSAGARRCAVPREAVSRRMFARRGFLFAVLVLAGHALSACGFTPIYARTGADDPGAVLGQIEVAPIGERSGQILRNHLIDMFDPRRDSNTKRFVLLVTLNESPQVLAFRRDDVISRGGYSASANFRLVDRRGVVVLSGGAGFGSDFEISDSERATALARESARDRLMQTLAEEIRVQLVTNRGLLARPGGATAAPR